VAAVIAVGMVVLEFRAMKRLEVEEKATKVES